MQLAGGGVDQGVRGVAAGKGAVEVARPHCLELVGQRIGPPAAFDDGQRAARVADDVRVGREVEARVDRAGTGRLAEGSGHVGRSHPSVAVPLGLTAADADAVDHPSPQEPVVGGGVGVDRVGPVAQVTPVEVVGDRPRDGEIGDRVLVGHRAVVALQVAAARLRRHRHRDSPRSGVAVP